MPDSLYIGLMSGTSVDGVDAVLVSAGMVGTLSLHSTHSEPIPPPLRLAILALCASGNDEIDRLGSVDVEVGQLFARAANNLLGKSSVRSGQVTAIGSHGQTIRHRPLAAHPFTLQIGDPNTIAHLTGITTVADFRRRDMAAGGQGAPLVPAFHAATFGSPDEIRAVVNIGGMANVTLLSPDDGVTGFDTGPGNVLLDAWHQRHHGIPLDRDGAWAASGRIQKPLLDHLLAESFFAAPPPKSTGRELFDLAWLDHHLATPGCNASPADVQATLAELTARSIADAVQRHGQGVGRVFLCGGGVHNTHLCRRIALALPGVEIASTAVLGIDPDWVEAIAFAWLARRTLAGLPGNIPAVTGAREPVVLGGIYPGRQGLD